MNLKLLATAAMLLSFAAPVIAADVIDAPIAAVAQLPSAYNWSGFYLGAQGGYNWNQATVSGTDNDIDSGIFGVHAGYNFQSGNIVYGIENDFNYNFEKGDNARVEWDASARGRVGYALDRTLIFATAGVAAAGAKASTQGIAENDSILIGWTAGGGVEHAVTDNILVRGEYRYSDFGSKDFGSSIGDVGATQHKVLLGTSYKF